LRHWHSLPPHSSGPAGLHTEEQGQPAIAGQLAVDGDAGRKRRDARAGRAVAADRAGGAGGGGGAGASEPPRAVAGAFGRRARGPGHRLGRPGVRPLAGEGAPHGGLRVRRCGRSARLRLAQARRRGGRWRPIAPSARWPGTGKRPYVWVLIIVQLDSPFSRTESVDSAEQAVAAAGWAGC
jgi:hypothetical protein